MCLSDEQLTRLADEAEVGMDETTLAHARQGWGPGVVDLLPAYIVEALRERARQEGVGEVTIMRHALEDYLAPQSA